VATKRQNGVDDERKLELGGRIRSHRLEKGIGVREMARRLAVSPSLISQIERGDTMPSVGTLYAIGTELDLSLDELLDGTGNGRSGGGQILERVGPVVRRADRQVLRLASGVTWERLTPDTEHDVDFLHVIYDVGSASCPEDALMRHPGREYGHVLTGHLAVTIGFETYDLGPGDSISLDSNDPHRLYNAGKEPCTAVWWVLDRHGSNNPHL
jgi:transcriptional regulator with XRE-family HTH domain